MYMKVIYIIFYVDQQKLYCSKTKRFDDWLVTLPKNDKKILLMKYQYVADFVVEFYRCATCINHKWSRKIALLKNFNLPNSEEPKSHSF